MRLGLSDDTGLPYPPVTGMVDTNRAIGEFARIFHAEEQYARVIELGRRVVIYYGSDLRWSLGIDTGGGERVPGSWLYTIERDPTPARGRFNVFSHAITALCHIKPARCTAEVTAGIHKSVAGFKEHQQEANSDK